MDHVDDVLAIAALDIAPRLLPQGWDVARDAPETYEGVKDYYSNHARLCVSPYFSNRRLFGSAAHCQAFDAWHDYRHITVDGAFDLYGEMKVNEAQQADLMEWFRTSRRPVSTAALKRASEVLTINNVGRLEYWDAFKAPPPDVRTFANGYLTAKGLIVKHAHCDNHRPARFDNRNEWTAYEGREA